VHINHPSDVFSSDVVAILSIEKERERKRKGYRNSIKEKRKKNGMSNLLEKKEKAIKRDTKNQYNIQTSFFIRIS